MHWQQLEEHEKTRLRVEELTSMLVASGIPEADALVAVDGLSDVSSRIHTEEPAKLFRELTEARRPPKRPRHIVFNAPHPKQPDFDHPSYIPDITSKAVFNAHMAQAASPYVITIARKIAQERGLKAPDGRAIEHVMGKVDWTRAAYELKTIGLQPPPTRMQRFLSKHVFKPLDKFTHETYFEKLWPAVTSVHAMVILFAAITGNIDKFSEPFAKFAGAVGRKRARRVFNATKGPTTVQHIKNLWRLRRFL